MELKRSLEDRRCPGCGVLLESKAEETFVCPAEGITWVAYGPQLLLRPAVVTRSPLELPWESEQVAA